MNSKINLFRDFPGGPGGEDPIIPLQRAKILDAMGCRPLPKYRFKHKASVLLGTPTFDLFFATSETIFHK